MTAPPPTPPHTQPQARACGADAPDPSGSAAVVVHSSTLLQGQRTLAIAHNGAVYRLQTTRQGKLILTK